MYYHLCTLDKTHSSLHSFIVNMKKNRYVLDCLRITPRDANFLPTKLGGTGNWDGMSPSLSKELKDDHVAVLRPELVQRWFARQEEFKNESFDKSTLLTGEVRFL
jgi:hypothetical protein